MPIAGLPRLLFVGTLLAVGAARAEEGMWPLQLLPAAAVRQQFGVDLTAEWLARQIAAP